MHSFIHLFIHSWIHGFSDGLVYCFMPSFIHAFMHSFMHSFVHWFMDSLIWGSRDLAPPALSYVATICTGESVSPALRRNYLKMCWKIFENSSKMDPKMVPNSWKIDLWRCLGTLWRPSWRQELEKHKKYTILGWPGGSKMQPKALKNLMKNRDDFSNDFETMFSRFWEDLGSQNLPKMRSLRIVFSTSLQICEKCDFE